LDILGVCDFTYICSRDPSPDGVSDEMDFTGGELGLDLIDGGGDGIEVKVKSTGGFESAFPVICLREREREEGRARVRERWRVRK